jgi:succinate dehydrogenase / fumarate reductase iron-sulfur subunit
MKERVVDKKYDPLVWLGNKIGIRNKDNHGREVAPTREASPVKRPAAR